MDRSGIGLTVAWVLAMFTGCGGNSSSQPEATAPSGSAPKAAAAADPATDPIAKAAFNFLDAVLKGDTQRAGAQLTPAAMQRFIENGNQFAPPGIDQATFRIGEVRKPSETQALVQCILTAKNAAGETKSEEMCCLMKLVENDWRISGIAYSTGPQRPPMILDFENPPQAPAKAPMAGATTATQPAVTETPGRPSPPRTAQEGPSSTLR